MQNQVLLEGLQEMERYNKAIDGNRRYVAKKLAEDEDYFSKLAKGQNPKYLLIGCSDSRAPPNEITETDPGDIFIHRNIANCVIPTDLNVNCVIQYAVEHLKVHNIVVMGHTFCGGIKAALHQESVGGLLDLWLNNIKMVYEKNQQLVDSFEDEDDRINCLCCMNVREQVMNIWRNPIVQKSWKQGHPVMVHGWLFRVESGLIEELSIDQSVPEDMSKIFAYKFQRDSMNKSARNSGIIGAPSNQGPKAALSGFSNSGIVGQTSGEEEDPNESPRRSFVRPQYQRLQSRLETTLKKFDNINQGMQQMAVMDKDLADEMIQMGITDENEDDKQFKQQS